MKTIKELEKQKKEIEQKIELLKKSENRIIINNTWDVTDYEKWYDEKYCLEAVKQNSYALQYVKNQTEPICLEAVKEDGDTLQYVKDQTESICLEAVREDGYALEYVDKRIFKED